MPAAATIADAIRLTSESVETAGVNLGFNLRTLMTTWLTSVFRAGVFNPDLATHREVQNWEAATQYARDHTLNSLISPQVDITLCVNVVWRTAIAASDASARGDISAGQLASVLAAWNATWGTTP